MNYSGETNMERTKGACITWIYSLHAVLMLLPVGIANATLDQENHKYHQEISIVRAKEYPPDYHFKYSYIVLYDNPNQVTRDIRSKVRKRLDIFELILKRESFGKIDIDAEPVYIDVREMGDHKLQYKTRTVFDWIDDIRRYLGNNHEHDVLAFSPIKRMKWASDSHSIGYCIEGKIYVSQEYYEYSEEGDVDSCALMVHKMLHGFGYNHQNLWYHQLNLLEWRLGFPSVLALDEQIADEYDGKIRYFSKHLLEVLDLLRRPKYSEACLDSDGLKFAASRNRAVTLDAWNTSGMDVDNDDIVDAADDYFLSSPLKGSDTDADGIVDQLDLCPWNKITVTGNVAAGKINIIATEDPVRISFNSPTVSIVRIKAKHMRKVLPMLKPRGVNGCFPDIGVIESQGNSIQLSDNARRYVVRLEVYYTYNGRGYLRPFYLYFPDKPVYHIIHEREWFYYLRFGCDVPADLDLYEVGNYDIDFDGFVDKGKYSFIDELPEDYDWDVDGVPDVLDTLPTVRGSYSNEHVRGVKDSDGDGLGDPGYMDFSDPMIPVAYYFGEINRAIGKNPEYDWSPYFPGTEENKGCPDPDGDGVFWYDDPKPFVK
jgi:hypothetical protein